MDIPLDSEKNLIRKIKKKTEDFFKSTKGIRGMDTGAYVNPQRSFTLLDNLLTLESRVDINSSSTFRKAIYLVDCVRSYVPEANSLGFNPRVILPADFDRNMECLNRLRRFLKSELKFVMRLSDVSSKRRNDREAYYLRKTYANVIVRNLRDKDPRDEFMTDLIRYTLNVEANIARRLQEEIFNYMNANYEIREYYSKSCHRVSPGARPSPFIELQDTVPRLNDYVSDNGSGSSNTSYDSYCDSLMDSVGSDGSNFDSIDSVTSDYEERLQERMEGIRRRHAAESAEKYKRRAEWHEKEAAYWRRLEMATLEKSEENDSGPSTSAGSDVAGPSTSGTNRPQRQANKRRRIRN